MCTTGQWEGPRSFSFRSRFIVVFVWLQRLLGERVAVATWRSLVDRISVVAGRVSLLSLLVETRTEREVLLQQYRGTAYHQALLQSPARSHAPLCGAARRDRRFSVGATGFGSFSRKRLNVALAFFTR